MSLFGLKRDRARWVPESMALLLLYARMMSRRVSKLQRSSVLFFPGAAIVEEIPLKHVHFLRSSCPDVQEITRFPKMQSPPFSGSSWGKLPKWGEAIQALLVSRRGSFPEIRIYRDADIQVILAEATTLEPTLSRRCLQSLFMTSQLGIQKRALTLPRWNEAVVATDPSCCEVAIFDAKCGSPPS